MGKKINESPFKKLQVPVVRVLKGFFNLKKLGYEFKKRCCSSFC